MTPLPNEILHMVCTELWHQRDFNTLLNCACSGRQLADIAVTKLYRMQNVAPSSVHDKRGSIKLAGLWRSILLSSLSKTLYPYSQYIRTLDLDNLEQVIGNTNVEFKLVLFHGELEQFMPENISKIGKAITKQTPLLEELIGNVTSEELSRWIPKLPRLAHLTIWHGSSVKGTGNIIRRHCPSFKSLSLSKWNTRTLDRDLADFLNEISPQSLKSFKTSTYHHFGYRSFQALSCHGESLNSLKLMLPTSSIPKLLLLSGCINLVMLSLVGDGQYRTDLRTSFSSARMQAWSDLHKSYNNALHEAFAWLRDCKRLKNLTFTGFFSAPSLMALMLSGNNVYLTSLRYEGFQTRDTKRFFQAIANQTSLQSLWLKEDLVEYEWENGEEPPEVGVLVEVLVESLSRLVNLTDLHLRKVSISFVDRHFVQLAKSLPKLEVWSTNGCRLTDAIWTAVATLKSLRTLDLCARVNFTVGGILDYIDKLGPGNRGLALSMMLADISWAEQESIREKIDKKVKGSFRSTLSNDHVAYFDISEPGEKPVYRPRRGFV